MTELDDGSLEAWFWRRHANPRSGWSRVPVGAVIVYAVYRRDARLLAGALVWTVCNPFVFPPPETDEAWMTRAVLAERWWVRAEGNGTVGLARPNVFNGVAATGFCVALYAAWRRRPRLAAIGTALSVSLKLWWLRLLVRRYDARARAEE
ncbi:hypothetical protein BRC64_00780 [Halobacteriales archaeon QH_10_67_22]|nr:MAG: hypothetical protein BRC64_00780 [Halobacteriales archaeon QH_10_67_22]